MAAFQTCAQKSVFPWYALTGSPQEEAQYREWKQLKGKCIDAVWKYPYFSLMFGLAAIALALISIWGSVFTSGIDPIFSASISTHLATRPGFSGAFMISCGVFIFLSVLARCPPVQRGVVQIGNIVLLVLICVSSLVGMPGFSIVTYEVNEKVHREYEKTFFLVMFVFQLVTTGGLIVDACRARWSRRSTKIIVWVLASVHLLFNLLAALLYSLFWVDFSEPWTEWGSAHAIMLWFIPFSCTALIKDREDDEQSAEAEPLVG